MQARLTFIGADHEVTGSCHSLEVGSTKVLIDYGMEQGNNTYQNAELPMGYHEIDCVFLAHAHIDHAGILPWIHARGFRGQVIITYATADPCNITPKDSAHIQEMEAKRKNRKARRTGRGEVEALYTMQGAEDVLKHLEGVAYEQISKLNDNLTLRFTDVGHLLGSTSIEIWATEGAGKKKIVFSSNIRNKNKPLIRDPQYITGADYVVMEAIYGSRYHKEGVDHVDSLVRIVQETPDRQGNMVIPAFAVGRTQELLYLICHIKEERFVTSHDSSEVYADSPPAVEAIHVFKDNMLECYDGETEALVERGINPIDFPGLKFSITSEGSKNTNLDIMPKVIISAAGTRDVGRIRHHLKHNLWKSECPVVFAGYQAEGTLGRILQDGAQTVKVFGGEIDMRVHIETMEGVSGHTDRDGLITWISVFEKRSDYVFVVHGSEESCVSLTDVLNTQLKLAAKASFPGSQFDLIKGFRIKETEGILIKKKTVVKRRASGVYTRLVDAGKMLLDVVHRSEGGVNKDLTRFTEQIFALCDKWDRQDVTDRRFWHTTKVQIHTDGFVGGSSDGPSGYGAVLHFTDGSGQLHEKTMSGGYVCTANNQMELMVAIVGLETLNRSCQVELYSDSKYLTDAFNQHWIDNWVVKGWNRGKSGPAKNIDLWKRLLKARELHQVKFTWVKGHAGHPENEKCDTLATSAADGENLMANQGLEA